MKLKLMLTIGLVVLISQTWARPAEEEYAEYDEAEAPAPPPKKAPPRSPLVGRRNPLAGKNNKATTSTTTTTEAPPQEEEEAVEGDYEDEQAQAEPSSTTEAPKKLLRGGVVRPFRSNEDLLNSLKKRREQVVLNKHAKPAAAPADQEEAAPAEKEVPKAKPNNGRKNRFSKEKQPEGAEESSSTAAPARTGRRFHG